MEATIEFSPAIPLPAPYDIEKRIQQLRNYLDPNHPDYQPEQQHTNIKAAIKLYEDGKIDGWKPVYITDGKIVPKEEIFRGGSWSWSEGMGYQVSQWYVYAHSPMVNFREVSLGLSMLSVYIPSSDSHTTRANTWIGL
jgi:hypothetical protein